MRILSPLLLASWSGHIAAFNYKSKTRCDFRAAREVHSRSLGWKITTSPRKIGACARKLARSIHEARHADLRRATCAEQLAQRQARRQCHNHNLQKHLAESRSKFCYLHRSTARSILVFAGSTLQLDTAQSTCKAALAQPRLQGGAALIHRGGRFCGGWTNTMATAVDELHSGPSISAACLHFPKLDVNPGLAHPPPFSRRTHRFKSIFFKKKMVKQWNPKLCPVEFHVEKRASASDLLGWLSFKGTLPQKVEKKGITGQLEWWNRGRFATWKRAPEARKKWSLGACRCFCLPNSPTFRRRGWGVPNSIFLVIPIKGKMEGVTPLPNSIFIYVSQAGLIQSPETHPKGGGRSPPPYVYIYIYSGNCETLLSRTDVNKKGS